MMTKLTRAAGLTLCAVTTLACADEPAATSPGDALAGEGPAFTATAAGQTQGVLDLIDAQDAAWAAKDGVAYGATYTEDAEVINPVGGILAGRAMIASQHVFLFNPVTGPFRATTSTWTLRDLVFLSGHVALVKLDVVLTGLSAVPPGLPQSEPGVVRTRVTWVAVKQGAGWLILHQQMTPLPATS